MLHLKLKLLLGYLFVLATGDSHFVCSTYCNICEEVFRTFFLKWIFNMASLKERCLYIHATRRGALSKRRGRVHGTRFPRMRWQCGLCSHWVGPLPCAIYQHVQRQGRVHLGCIVRGNLYLSRIHLEFVGRSSWHPKR